MSPGRRRRPPHVPESSRRSRRGGVLALIAIAATLLALGLDQAGRATYVLVGGRPARLGGELPVEARVPAGRYEAYLLARWTGVLHAGLEARGARRETAGLTSASLWPVARVPLGTVTTDGTPLPLRLTTAAPRGSLVGLVLEPASPLPLSRDGAGRAAMAVAVAATVLATGTARRRYLALPVLLLLLLWIREPLFGLVPFRPGDMRTAFHPWHELSRRSVAAGLVPLWNPHTFLGLPHLANMQTQVLFPPVAACLAAGATFAARETLASLLAFAAAATGTSLLARSLGARRPGALLAGLLFATSPPLVNGEQAPLVAATALIPWLGLAARSGSAVQVAVAVATALLAGHLQMFSYGIVAMALLALPPLPRRPRWALAAGLLLGLLLSSALAIPLLENADRSVRRAGLASEHASAGRLPLATAARMLKLERADRLSPQLGTARGSVVVVAGLASLPLFSFAVGDLASPRRRRRLARLLLLAAAGVGIGVGELGPLSPAGILAHLPLFGAQRTPSRAFTLAILAVCLVAGRGLDRYVACARRRDALLPVAAGLALLLAALGIAALAAPREPGVRAGALVQAAILMGAAALRRFVPRRRAPAVALALVALVAVERLDDAAATRGAAPPEVYSPRPERLHARPPGRLLLVAAGRDNEVLLSGCLSPWGYDPVIPLTTALLWTRLQPALFAFDVEGRLQTPKPTLDPAAVVSPASRRMLADMGVEVVRLPPGATPPGGDLSDVDVTTPREGGLDLRLPGARRAHLLSSGPVALEVRDVSPHEVRVGFPEPPPAGSELCLADALFPGWEALAGGRRLRIDACDGALRRVALPEGTREVVFRYRPFSYRLGLFLSVIGGCLVALAVTASRGGARRRGETPVTEP